MRATWLFGLVGMALTAAACGDDGPSQDTDGGTEGGSGTEDATGTDGGTDSGGPAMACGELPAAASGTCEVTQVGSSGLVLRGNVLAPEETFEGGEILIDAGGLLTCVGCDCSGAAGYGDATVVTCADAVISPGLINPHEHITFAANRPIGEGPQRYDHRHEWRTGANQQMELDVDGGASQEEVLAAELRFLMSGVTAMASAGGEQGLVRNLDVGSMLEGLPVAVANSDTFPLDDANGTLNDQGCNYGGGATTSQDIQSEAAYLPHIAEGVSQAARNELTCTSMGSLDVLAPQTAVIHAVGVGAEEARLLGEDYTRVVWSPRSNIVLYGNTAPVTLLDQMGVAMSLGTDWVASGSMNMLRELRCADELNDAYFGGYFSDEDLWKMATFNGALSTGSETVIGALKPGYVADIAVFRRGDRGDHQAVVEAELEDVVLVLRGGEVMYGDDLLLEDPGLGGADCERLDVCGTAKRACVARDTGGTSLTQLRSAIESTYPLFFCDVPEDEPSCVPRRDNEYMGGPVDSDLDGDGVANDADNCPDIFNPQRPFESGQGDADQDGMGDACDVCPLDNSDSCAGLSGLDIDADGVLNGEDNCVLVANPDQADADEDGKGNACDDCDQPNPGAQSCALSIPAVRNPNDPAHPAPGTAVTLVGAYVTAVRDDGDGFAIQDDSLEPWSGISVFGSADVSVGDRITITGVYEEFFDQSQLTDPVVTIEASGELPFEPLTMAAAEVSIQGADAEFWESMLIRVEDVELTDANPDDPDDYDEFEVTAGLRVDDLFAQDLDNNICVVGDSFAAITGVHTFSFGNYKINPRGPSDVDSGSCSPF